MARARLASKRSRRSDGKAACHLPAGASKSISSGSISLEPLRLTPPRRGTPACRLKEFSTSVIQDSAIKVRICFQGSAPASGFSAIRLARTVWARRLSIRCAAAACVSFWILRESPPTILRAASGWDFIRSANVPLRTAGETWVSTRSISPAALLFSQSLTFFSERRMATLSFQMREIWSRWASSVACSAARKAAIS